MITDVVRRDEADLARADAYVCGPPPMVEAAIELLPALGVADKRIFYDKFTTTGETGLTGDRPHDRPTDTAGDTEPLVEEETDDNCARTQRAEGRVHRRRGRGQGVPGLPPAALQLLHSGQAQAVALRGRHRRGAARSAALPRPGLALRLRRRQGRLPAGVDGAQGLGIGPAGARARTGLGRQGLPVAGARLARVPRPQRGVGAHPLPLQRERRPPAQPEHRGGPAGEGVRAVEPQLGATSWRGTSARGCTSTTASGCTCSRTPTAGLRRTCTTTRSR